MAANKRNFGYGRRMDYAGKQALRERYGGGHFGTVATHADRWGRFCNWAKEHDVKDMQRVTADLVREFARDLEADELAVATRQNHVSTINTVMLHASGGGWEKLSPREVVGESRHSVREDPPMPLNRELHDQAVISMQDAGMDRAAAVADLAREFGVRSEEAVLANLNRWKTEAETFGRVNVQEGAKGGRDVDRWVPVTEEGREALAYALSVRPEGSKNMLDPSESYTVAREGWIREGREAYAKMSGARGYHDARAAYACERYEALTGHPAPVVAGGRVADKEEDTHAREIIAQELGHGRIDVVASYVGSAK